jgi:cytochrome c-type biogenesis protein CcmH
VPRALRRLLAVVLAAALVAPSVAPGAPRAKTTLNDVEDEVMCPVCGTPLNLATDAPSANDERALIRRLIAQGYTKDQIKRRLAQEFGPRVLALPPQRGFDLAAYLVPILLGLAGLIAIAVLAVRWRGRRPGPAPDDGRAAPPRLEAADARRLDEDLARYDR